MKNNIKKYGIKAVGVLGIFLCVNLLGGCKDEKIGSSINEKENAAVDNLLENSEEVDNLRTEEVQGGNSTDVVENSASDNTNVEESELPTEEVYISPEVSIIMVGDMLMHTPVEKSALQEDGTYSYDAIFVNTAEKIK